MIRNDHLKSSKGGSQNWHKLAHEGGILQNSGRLGRDCLRPSLVLAVLEKSAKTTPTSCAVFVLQNSLRINVKFSVSFSCLRERMWVMSSVGSLSKSSSLRQIIDLPTEVVAAMSSRVSPES